MSGKITMNIGEGIRWGNLANGNGAATRKRRGSASKSRSRSRSASKSRNATRRNAAKGPTEGNVRGEGNSAEMYHKGKWVKAYDPGSEYGGPYANMRNLQKNARYQKNMEDIYGSNWKTAAAKARRAEKVAARGAANNK